MIKIHQIRDTHTVKGPRVPVPRVTRKSAKEMQVWRHEKMRDEINEAKAARVARELASRTIGEGNKI